MTISLRIQVASVPDRDGLVVEVWSGSEQVAELRKEDGAALIQVYSRQSGWWDFPYADFVAALQRARDELERQAS
jgi:hypothetical protein